VRLPSGLNDESLVSEIRFLVGTERCENISCAVLRVRKSKRRSKDKEASLNILIFPVTIA